MNHVAFVAAGHDNCRTVAGTNVGERHQNVDLADVPCTRVMAKRKIEAGM
jgi:hypothetical protein